MVATKTLTNSTSHSRESGNPVLWKYQHIFFIIIVVSINFSAALFTKSLWGDEVWSIHCAEKSWNDFFSTLSSDYHPPLYFIFLKFWISFFGNSEISVRIFQGIQSCFFLFSTLFLFRKIFPEKRYHPFFFVFLFSGELWLFSPMIRYYVFAATLVVSATVFLLQWIETHSKKYFYLLIFNYIALLYTDYPSSIIIVIHGIYIVFFHKDFFKKFLFATTAVAFAFLPWLIIFIRQLQQLHHSPQIADFNTSPLSIILKFSYSIYAFLFGETVFPSEIITIITVFVLSVIFFVERKNIFKIFKNHSTIFLLFIISIGILFTSIITTVISQHTSFIYTPSRTFFALPFFFIFLGKIYSSIEKKIIQQIFIILLLLVNFYSITNWAFNRNFMMPVYASPWKEIFSSLNKTRGLIISDESEVYKYYYNQLFDVPYKIFPTLISVQSLDELKSELSIHKTKNLFLLTTGRESTELEINTEIIDYLKLHGKKLNEQKFLLIDEDYKKFKNKILQRSSYDAKFTVTQYQLP